MEAQVNEVKKGDKSAQIGPVDIFAICEKLERLREKQSTLILHGLVLLEGTYETSRSVRRYEQEARMEIKLRQIFHEVLKTKSVQEVRQTSKLKFFDLNYLDLGLEIKGKEAGIGDPTSIAEQDNHKQDVHYLNGGEETSLVFAYRLALNSIVEKVSIDSEPNRPKLDEPTYRFGKEQL